MKNDEKIALGLIAALGIFPLQASSATSEVVFQRADTLARNTVVKLLGPELKKAESFSDVPSVIMTSSMRVSEAPFLFVMFQNHYHCGNVNCEVWGFERTSAGWHKVFQGNGEKWTVKAHAVGGHHDIAELRHDSAFQQSRFIFRWDGKRYRRR